MNNSVVLAYSGGLDTSVMVHWLKSNYNMNVITVTCDVGQGDNLELIRNRALASGAKEALIIDAREEFVKDYLWPLVKSGATYESRYLLGTISRPLISKKLVEVALNNNIPAVAHGATGKGNDQVRFEYSIRALAPNIKIIAPWREWNIKSRQDAIAYATENNIQIPSKSEVSYSRDRNLWYISHEGGDLEDISKGFPSDILMFTKSLKDTPSEPESVIIEFEFGAPKSISKSGLFSLTAPIDILNTANEIAGKHGIGVTDMIENRLIGIKSRGVYEVPGGTLLYRAHEALESVCLDRDTMHLKQNMKELYGKIIYDGKWFSVSRKALDALIGVTQHYVSGKVSVELYKGNCTINSIESSNSIYSRELATFEKDNVYNHSDASGFINLYTLLAKISSSTL